MFGRSGLEQERAVWPLGYCPLASNTQRPRPRVSAASPICIATGGQKKCNGRARTPACCPPKAPLLPTGMTIEAMLEKHARRSPASAGAPPPRAGTGSPKMQVSRRCHPCAKHSRAAVSAPVA